MWRIFWENGALNISPSGCVFNVNLDPNHREKRSISIETKKIYKKTSETFLCEVDYPIKYCYMEMPPNSKAFVGSGFSAEVCNHPKNFFGPKIQFSIFSLKERNRWADASSK